MTDNFSVCAIVPVYNHAHALAATVRDIRAHGLPVILIDDGSDSDAKRTLASLVQEPAVSLITHPFNRGKGAAVKTGLLEASAKGFSHALQVDADGQHDCRAIPTFIASAQAAPASLICGIPRYDQSIPRSRYYSRYLTHIWVWINTLSLQLKDTMCGFRVYPVPGAITINRRVRGERMDFDTEFIVRWFWAERPVVHLPVRVTYPSDGISHFQLWRDNKLISLMHARLFFGMLARLPVLLTRKFKKLRYGR